MGLSKNKSNLADFLSNELIDLAPSLPEREIVTAGGFCDIEAAVSSTGRDVQILTADHEKADTRLIVHAIDACILSGHGYSCIADLLISEPS